MNLDVGNFIDEKIESLLVDIDDKIGILTQARARLEGMLVGARPKTARPVDGAAGRKPRRKKANSAAAKQSDFKNVYFLKSAGKKNPWHVIVSENGKNKSLGTFPTQEDAARTAAKFKGVSVESLRKKDSPRPAGRKWRGGRDLPGVGYVETNDPEVI